MSELKVHDGHAGDGVDTQIKTFEYEEGFYHRREREFFGFETVKEHQHNDDGSVYRSVINTYHNDSYYNKGLQKHSVTVDGAGNKYLETENTYLLRNVETGNELSNPQHLTAVVFPELVRTDKRFFEGQAVAGKSTYETFAYNASGDIIHLFQAGDPGAADDVEADIAYFTDDTAYIIAPNSILVKGNGVLMRKRESTIQPGTGDVTEIRQYLADGSAAVTNVTYDQYGNIDTLTGPANYKGERYALSYTYDRDVYTYNTEVKDSFGYVSSAGYDLRFGTTLFNEDINKQVISYEFDQFGRNTVVIGPYQQGEEDYTIRFEYHHDADIPWALTQHMDVYRDVNDPIETVTFMDGLGRAIQTKKDATIYRGETAAAQDSMIVSGHQVFDAFGRTVQAYYPVTEPKGTQSRFNTAIDGIRPTVTEYDVLDRALIVTAPDNSVTRTAYGFGTDRDGRTQFLTRVTDANTVPKESFRNVREAITAIKEFNNGGAQVIWTSYQYDALKQITAVIDDQHNTTQVEYDNLGRRTVIDSPDAGKTAMVYDTASNLREKITANLRAEGKAIVYDYDYTRLSAITYPDFSDNNVSYTYGRPNAQYNRANRIVTVTDESGTAEYFYGPLGETVKTIRTIASDTQGNSAHSAEVYVTEQLYDTWNRMQRLLYPDGEVLTHHYDAGGLLRQIYGDKGVGSDTNNPNNGKGQAVGIVNGNGKALGIVKGTANAYGVTGDGNVVTTNDSQWHYDYLERLEYDKFEQRIFVKYGNGTQSTYSYDPRNRRLANLKAGSNLLSRNFQDLVYDYDAVGNILGLANRAADVGESQKGGATDFNYAYDDLYRLVHAEGTFDFDPDKQHHYTLDMSYDTIHNIRRKNQNHRLRQPSGTWITQKQTTHDLAYAYSGAQPHAPTHIGDRTFSYDANGNQTGWDHDQNGTRRTIVWDEENRIQEIANNGHTMRYKYDHDGNRVIKRGPQGETVYVNQYFTIRNRENGTKHVYVGDLRISSKLMKQDKPGSNPNGSIPEEKDVYFYHPDHLGSSAYVSDVEGDLYQHLEYFPFGETFVEEVSNTQRTPYWFTAKELDEEIDAYYFGARYYDPMTAVWMSADPILWKYLDGKGSSGGVFNSLNLSLYSYVHLSPIKYLDPDGRDIAIIFNGATTNFNVDVGWKWPPVSIDFELNNPFGHSAIAVTGHGVYSYGNETPLGSSLKTYLQDQSSKRDSSVFIIKTTPEQDQKVIDFLTSTYKDNKLPNFKKEVLLDVMTLGLYEADTCAGRVKNAAKASGALNDGFWANVGDYLSPDFMPSDSSITGNINADESIFIPKGNTKPLSNSLNQFEPLTAAPREQSRDRSAQ